MVLKIKYKFAFSKHKIDHNNTIIKKSNTFFFQNMLALTKLSDSIDIKEFFNIYGNNLFFIQKNFFFRSFCLKILNFFFFKIFEINNNIMYYMFFHKFIINIIDVFMGILYRSFWFINRFHFFSFFCVFIENRSGWRYFKSLPTKGQRTRSNAKTCKKNKYHFNNFLKKIYKSSYPKIEFNILWIFFCSERYNKLWYFQWKNEWTKNYKRRLNFFSKSKGFYKIDFHNLSKGKFSGVFRQSKPGKKKKVFNRKVFYIGFPHGFTKSIHKHMLTNKPFKTIQIMLYEQQEKIKKKKKISLKKKLLDKKKKEEKKKNTLKKKKQDILKVKNQKMRLLAKRR